VPIALWNGLVTGLVFTTQESTNFNCDPIVNRELSSLLFEYGSETDARGFLKTRSACRVTFMFRNASALKLESESGVETIILDSEWSDDNGEITFAWQSSVGFEGSIRARNWKVEIEPIQTATA
jgi:hypothetical protein